MRRATYVRIAARATEPCSNSVGVPARKRFLVFLGMEPLQAGHMG